MLGWCAERMEAIGFSHALIQIKTETLINSRDAIAQWVEVGEQLNVNCEMCAWLGVKDSLGCSESKVLLVELLFGRGRQGTPREGKAAF